MDEAGRDYAQGLLRCLEGLDDPRVVGRCDHLLFDIVAITLLAVMCGAEDWPDIKQFGASREEFLKTFLDLPHGIPSHDTFRRVFGRLDRTQFATCLFTWTQALHEATDGQVTDGKESWESRYNITDHRPRAKFLGHAIRQHWGIENGQHWILDVTFGEDSRRQQDRNGAANLAAVRRLGLSLLRQEQTNKRGVKNKRLQCALDPKYLLKVLAGTKFLMRRPCLQHDRRFVLRNWELFTSRSLGFNGVVPL